METNLTKLEEWNYLLNEEHDFEKLQGEVIRALGSYVEKGSFSDFLDIRLILSKMTAMEDIATSFYESFAERVFGCLDCVDDEKKAALLELYVIASRRLPTSYSP